MDAAIPARAQQGKREQATRAVEQQAFAFTVALLMPHESTLQELPRGLDWRRYADLKRRWGISMKALVRYSGTWVS